MTNSEILNDAPDTQIVLQDVMAPKKGSSKSTYAKKWFRRTHLCRSRGIRAVLPYPCLGMELRERAEELPIVKEKAKKPTSMQLGDQWRKKVTEVEG